MRRELNGQFKETLDAMTLNALLDAEGEWLLTEGETCSTETLEERLATVEKKLHEDYKAFFDAKEEHRLKLEKELEGILGRKISIQQGKHSGQLTLEYYGAEDLERLSEALRNLRV